MQMEFAYLLIAGLQQVKEGKTKGFNAVCDKLEKKYSDEDELLAEIGVRKDQDEGSGTRKMIAPRKVKFEAEKRYNENMKFRTYLKIHAEDRQFLELHNELFAGWDCSRCRNCCKMYRGGIPMEDVAKDAEHLGMTEEQFIEKYLEPDVRESGYLTKNKPCDFLQGDGDCLLGDHKPESCKKFPYTDQPERLRSLYSVLDAVEVCPVAFEIYERLKKEYGFRARR